jgi:archaemetzincin
MAPISIWWIGERPMAPELMERVRGELESAYGVPAARGEPPGRPADTFDPKRGQHLSGRMLAWLLQAAPPEGKLLGLTDQDLFIPILTYVFGEAQLGGRVAVASTARLREDLGRAGEPRFADRLVKEAIHEVGHAYGLVHCQVPRCVMSRAAGVRDVDEKSPELCPRCRHRLSEPGRSRHAVE